MGLEAATYIHQLNPSNPVGAVDPKAQGDDHLRLIKSTIQATFPNITGAMTKTQAQLNALPNATGLAPPANSVKIGAPAEGVAATLLRSDAQLVIDQTIAPVWTSTHRFAQVSSGEQLRLSFDTAYISFWNTANSTRRGYIQATTGGALTIESEQAAQLLSLVTNGGAVTSNSQFRGPNGAAGTPSYSFTADPDSGFYRVAVDNVRISAGGIDICGFGNGAGIAIMQPFGVVNSVSDGSVGAPIYSFNNDADCGMYRVGANVVGISCGGVLAGQFSLSGTAQFSAANGTVSLPGYTFLADNNKGFYHVGANIIGASIAGTLVAQIVPATSGGLHTADYGGTLQVVGYRNIPQNSQSANYTAVLADSGKHLLHPSGGGAGDTFTIPANGAVAYDIGTAITFVNRDSNSLAIAITTDTMTLAGSTSTGTRTLGQNGIATALKVGATDWIISGTGLS